MKILATTLDDSFGESFDKVSKMLNLGLSWWSNSSRVWLKREIKIDLNFQFHYLKAQK